MPSYKLTYFDMKGGRGESIRMAFHISGIPFTDDRIKREDFLKIKETLPFGQLPILTVDNKTVIPQEMAILKYIGRLSGLYPKDPEEMVKTDIMISVADDLYLVVIPFFGPDHAGKEEIKKMIIEEKAPKLCEYLDKYLAKQGTTFCAGNNLTIADLRLLSPIAFFQSGMLQGFPTDLISKYPHIVKLHKAITEHEKVASWIKSQA